MALGAVADNGHLLLPDQCQVCIFVVVGFRHIVSLRVGKLCVVFVFEQVGRFVFQHA